MDAEHLDFPDASFDFIWSWGVIHHSSNTDQILAEMNRVMRPGATTTLMVYHPSFFFSYIFTGLFRGIICGGFLKARSIHELAQLYTDGAIARYYTPDEWRQQVESRGFVVENIIVKGQKSELFPLPASRFKNWLMSLVPSSLTRFILNTCSQGSFLISTLRKP